MNLIRVGVDLAKNVFQVHGVDRGERAVWRRRLRREDWMKVLSQRVGSIEPTSSAWEAAYEDSFQTRRNAADSKNYK